MVIALYSGDVVEISVERGRLIVTHDADEVQLNEIMETDGPLIIRTVAEGNQIVINVGE